LYVDEKKKGVPSWKSVVETVQAIVIYHVGAVCFVFFQCWYLGRIRHYSGVERFEYEKNHRRARVEILLPA